VLNNPADLLSMVLTGTLGRSGRKRARRAKNFLTGNSGFLSTSAIIGAAGVAWGIYDTLKNQNQGAHGALGAQGAPGAMSSGVPPQAGTPVPPIPAAFDAAIDPVVRIIRLAVSAANADGQLTDAEREMILERARAAGIESVVDAELAQSRPLAEIARGISDPAMKHELYVIAFTIVRADENVSGAERIYLAQLAHQLGLDPAAVQKLETETAAKIDAEPEN
jgi:uncharacterized membrane protein YebE (DUF533 family)